MKASLILNPAAGGGRAGQRREAAVARLGALGFDLEVQETTHPGHATALAAAATGDLIIAAGGDGTTFEVVNGLTQRQKRPALGILPLGTGNSFLRDFAITGIDDAFAALGRQQTRPVDLVRVEHREGSLHYLNLLSVGFTAEAGHVTNERYKSLGAAGYILATLQCLAGLSAPSFPYGVDDGPLDPRPTTLVSFSNSRFTGGTMQMAPSADPTDGSLDIVRIGPLSRRRFLGAFPRIFRGTHVQMPEITETRAQEVRFDLTQPATCMVDGEIVSLHLERLCVEAGALELMA
jgi:diacylglycerol kinase (ATP)